MQLLPISGKRCSASGPSRLKKKYMLLLFVYTHTANLSLK